MIRRTTWTLATLSLAIGLSTVHAAILVSPGDIFVNSLTGIVQYKPDGTEARFFNPNDVGTNIVLEGAVLTADRRLATTSRVPASGVLTFDQVGASAFSTPAIGTPSDMSRFSDGTLAINDQSLNAGKIALYSPSGTFLSSITHPDIANGTLFGSAVGPDNTLWVTVIGKAVSRFDRNGNYLGGFTPGFEVLDIAVDADGSLWAPRSNGDLYHFSASGAVLGSFSTLVAPSSFSGVAIAPDGSLYVTSLLSTSLFHYSPSGALLESFPLTVNRPVFLSVAFVPEPFLGGGSLMLAFGCAAALNRYRGRVSISHAGRR